MNYLPHLPADMPGLNYIAFEHLKHLKLHECSYVFIDPDSWSIAASVASFRCTHTMGSTPSKAEISNRYLSEFLDIAFTFNDGSSASLRACATKSWTSWMAILTFVRSESVNGKQIITLVSLWMGTRRWNLEIAAHFLCWQCQYQTPWDLL